MTYAGDPRLPCPTARGGCRVEKARARCRPMFSGPSGAVFVIRLVRHGSGWAGDGWRYELKADWYRGLAFRQRDGVFLPSRPGAIWPDTFPTNRLPEDPLRLLPDPRPAGSCVSGAQMLAGFLAQRALALVICRSSPSGPRNSTSLDCARAGCSSAAAAWASGGRSGGSRSARSALRGTISVSVIAWSLSECDDSESGRVTDSSRSQRAPDRVGGAVRGVRDAVGL